MKHMGSADRLIGLVIAVGVAVVWCFSLISGTLALVLGAMAPVLVLTSMVSICPADSPFEFATRRVAGRSRP